VSADDTAIAQASLELFRNNPLPMYVCDLETLRFLEVNAAAVAHYGYSRDEFLAMRITDIRPPEDVPRVLAEVRDLRAEAPRPTLQNTGEWHHRRKDGRDFYVRIFARTVQFARRPIPT
jgi:PAS domain S-box-containing protein